MECVSFPKLGKFSAITSSNKFSTLSSLFSSGTPHPRLSAPWSQHCALHPTSERKARPVVGLDVHLALRSSTAEA